MSHQLPGFPVRFLDARRPAYLLETHWILVLQGSSSPPERPLFSLTPGESEIAVDDQGRWGAHDWHIFPQQHDPSSPWLSFIPVYSDNQHITRSTVHKDMIVRAGKTEDEKQMYMFTAEDTFKEKLKAYAKDTIALAEQAVQTRLNADLIEDSQIVWPTTTIERATYLWRQIIAGVPSINSFKRALTCLRRATLELEGFSIWASVMGAPVESRIELAMTMKDKRRMCFRGAFLDGSRSDWLDAGSQLRRAYMHMERWGTPVYVLVKQEDWNLEPHLGLTLGSAPFIPSGAIEEREKAQLPFYCYPPDVNGSVFERTARGVFPHPQEGVKGAIEEFNALRVNRVKTQHEQHNARLGDLWQKAVGSDKRPHPEIQARVHAKNGPPPRMDYWPLSDVLRTHAPSHLAPDISKGTFLPRPSLIWGAQGEGRLKMLETLTAVWKLLVLRPCLFRRQDLSPKQAYLGSQAWRDILKRIGSSTSLSAMWTGGKPELWGQTLQPSVLRRIDTLQREPTLSKMDCVFDCSPIGKFGIQQDPDQHLQHFVLFRLVELHVLHDFASYHPSLQRKIDGHWCPPPFDASEVLADSPDTFPGLTVDVSEQELQAMQDIVRIVRWNGAAGPRPWEMPDGAAQRNWLAAFRSFLRGCPNAWVNNPLLEQMSRGNPDLDLLTCDMHNPDVPLSKVVHFLIGTHLLLTMRAGRLPWLWFNKPVLNHLACAHNPQ